MDRSIFENPIWQNQVAFRLFFYLVGKAAFKDGIQKGNITLNRGQFLRSYRRLQDDLAYSENNAEKVYSTATLKRCVDRLIADGRILAEECELGTLFTVVNYEQYQAFQPYEEEELGTATKQQRNSNETIRTNANYADKRSSPSEKAQSAAHPIWEDALQMLTSTGDPERSARAFLGRALKEYGEGALNEAISACILEQPVSPKGFLIACLKSKKPLSAASKRPQSGTAVDSCNLSDPNRYQERSGRIIGGNT